jgi:isoleucyl-tRNA synthetase
MSTPEGKSYKDTLFLPKTDFPMKGNLTVREPARLDKWNSEDLYARIIAKRKAENAPRFILHDGPPFANGDVHMGTGLNKVLKDFVVKSKTMAGFEAPYIPGWDCHGLPIEFKVMQDEDARDIEPAEIRRRCETFARGWIDTQRESFKRLGVFGDWDNPYLTLDPGYEANILRTFAALIEKGCIYQSKKPVQWSFGAKTALAEAEVEYQVKKSTAVFVKFELPSHDALPAGSSIAIWTTTPWTLPANLAIAVHERFTYTIGKYSNGETIIVVRDLLVDFQEKTGLTLEEQVGEIKGAELEGLEAQHPFLDRASKVILAPFVTTESGTGAVHIAPGHGADDYSIGQQNGLAVLSPVDDDGLFTDECGLPELVGTHVFKGNTRIVEILTEKGALLGEETYEHSYPHCWRSKTPIIFRAVEQFFISMEGLREKLSVRLMMLSGFPIGVVIVFTELSKPGRTGVFRVRELGVFRFLFSLRKMVSPSSRLIWPRKLPISLSRKAPTSGLKNLMLNGLPFSIFPRGLRSAATPWTFGLIPVRLTLQFSRLIPSSMFQLTFILKRPISTAGGFKAPSC